uniref:Uncharacterized protein n=1 Tax=Parascaris equorum TaxID=6256 RepID=A0A914RPN4_PAREQ
MTNKFSSMKLPQAHLQLFTNTSNLKSISALIKESLCEEKFSSLQPIHGDLDSTVRNNPVSWQPGWCESSLAPNCQRPSRNYDAACAVSPKTGNLRQSERGDGSDVITTNGKT